MHCPITPQLVGDQLPGWSFLMLQHLTKEARSGSTIATFGNQTIDYVSILIDSSPQIEVLTSDFDEELIYMPLDNLFSCRLARMVRPRHDARSGFRTWLFFGHVEPGNVRPIPCSRFLGPRARCYMSM